MDQKLYYQIKGGERQEFDGPVVLLSELMLRCATEEMMDDGEKKLARKELTGQHYSYQLQEPLGGSALLKLHEDGQRFDLWIAYGNWVGQGADRKFNVVATFLVRNLVPHSVVISRDNQVVLYCDTLNGATKQ